MSRILKESRDEVQELYSLGLITKKDHNKMMKLTARDIEVPSPKTYSSKQIVSLRKQLNCSQKVFAEIVGVTVGTISKWERGINQPDKIYYRFFRVLEKEGLEALH